MNGHTHIESEHLHCYCNECTAGMSFGVVKAVRFVLFLLVCALVGINADIAHRLIYMDVDAGWLHWGFLAFGPLIGWWCCRLGRF